MKLMWLGGLAVAMAPAGADAQSLTDILNRISKGVSSRSAPARVAVVGTSGRPVSRTPAFGSIARADVAGVRLGMTPANVRAALTASGFRVTSTTKAPSFQQLVARKAASRNPAIKAPWTDEGIGEIAGNDPAGQRIAVKFVALPTGPVVSYIHFSVDESRITRASFADAVKKKYGPYTDAQEGMLWYYWCDGGTIDCAHRTIGGDFPFIQYTAGPGMAYLEVSDQNVSGKAQAAMIDKDVDRIAPMQRARL